MEGLHARRNGEGYRPQIDIVSESSSSDDDSEDQEVAQVAGITLATETQYSSLFSSFVYSKLSADSETSTIPLWKKSLKITLFAVAIIIGYVSWYPLALGVFNTLEISSLFIKAVLTLGSWVTFGSLHAWGTIKIVQVMFRDKVPNEAELLTSNRHPIMLTLYKIIVLTLGAFAPLPNAYFSYALNDENIVWPIIYVLGSWAIFSYAIHNMFEEIHIPKFGFLSHKCPDSFVKKVELETKKQDLIDKLKYFQERIPQATSEDIDDIKQLTIDYEDCHEDFTETFFKAVEIKYNEKTTHKSINSIMSHKAIQYTIKSIAAVLTLATIAGNGLATYLLISEFTSSVILKIVVIMLALSPSYLTYSVNRDSFLFLIKKLMELIDKAPPTTLSGAYYKKTTIATMVSTVILTLMSISANYIFAREVFGKNNFINWLLVVAIIINSFALTILPTLDLSKIILDKIVSKLNDSFLREKHRFYKKIEDLYTVIISCQAKELFSSTAKKASILLSA